MKIIQNTPHAEKIVEELKQLELGESNFDRYDIIVTIEDEHSSTYENFKSFSEKHEGGGLIIFDGHPDLLPEIDGQEDYPRRLINDGYLDPNKLIIVGIRKETREERDFAKYHKLKTFNMKRIYDIGLPETCDTVMELASQWPASYLSIDIDVVDPVFAPGTKAQEPGGLTSRELIYFIQRIKNLKNLKAADLVGICPELDKNNLTVKLGAKILREIGNADN